MHFANTTQVRNKSQSIYHRPETIVFQNGKFYPISELDPMIFAQTMHYGFGVFEGMRSYETVDGPRIFKATSHFQRLINSAEQLKLKVRFSAPELKTLAYQLLDLNHLTDAYIRPLVYTGENMSLMPTREANVLMMAWKWGRLLGDKPVNLMIVSNPRPEQPENLLEAKVCGHYVQYIMASSEARAKGFHDALFLDKEGFVAQTPGANLFVEINDTLYTPKTGHIMPGITRNMVIGMARQLKMKVVEKDITTEELFHADGAFLTGTATEIAPVASVNKNKFKMQWHDTLGYVLSRKYRQIVTNSDTHDGTLI